MSDELDRLWPEWMVAKRNELRAERMTAARAHKDAAGDPHAPVECSAAELQRRARQDARRRKERDDDAFYRPDKFKGGAR